MKYNKAKGLSHNETPKGGGTMKKIMLAAAGVLLFLDAGSALADKSAVRLEVPANAGQGEKITITLFARHSANNFLHYTKRLNLTINGQEAASWEFSAMNLPESAEFSRSFEYVLTGPITLESSAICNVHGSANTATATVGLR